MRRQSRTRPDPTIITKRKELLAILRSRVAARYYDRPDVIDRVARAILRYIHREPGTRPY